MNNVESTIYNRFKDFQKRHVNGSGRMETIHVSDIVQECFRKSYYSMKFPAQVTDDQQMGILYAGQAIHNFSRLGEIHEEVLCYDFVNNKPCTIDEVKEMTPEQRKNVITGAPDDIILDDKLGIIISDKKTWFSNNYKKTTANQSHIDQVNIYKWLLWRTKGLIANHAVILYLDFFTRFKDPLPIEVELLDLMDIENMVMERIRILRSGLPPANPCYLCDGKNKDGRIYCSYKEICDKNET